MSVWETVQGTYRDYNHWPNPFRTTHEEMQVLACNGEEWLGLSKATALTLGSWFFSNFIPSPVEITRKTLTGGYRCGFYLPVKAKSPLDVIWRDGKGSMLLRRALGPLVTAAWVYWAADTIYSGLSSMTSLAMMQEACGADFDNCIWSNGQISMGSGDNPNNGGNAYVGTWQPPRFTGFPPAGGLGVDGTGFTKHDVFLEPGDAGENLIYCAVWISDGQQDQGFTVLKEFGPPGPAQPAHIQGLFQQTTVNTFFVRAHTITTDGLGVRARVFIPRWIVNFSPSWPQPPALCATFA